MARTVKVKQLKAKQIEVFEHPEGGNGLLMVATNGTVYLKSEKGWVAYDMTEAPHDDQEV